MRVGDADNPISGTPMRLGQTTWTLAMVLACSAGWLDWRTRRIPKWLTVSGFFAGVAANTVLGGWRGLAQSSEGAGLALGLLLPLVLVRGLGAGDWKLMGAMGAVMGWRPMLLVLFTSILAAGAIAAIQVILSGRITQTLLNMWELVKGWGEFGLRPHPEISLDNPKSVKLPFGAAVAAATVFSFVVAHWKS